MAGDCNIFLNDPDDPTCGEIEIMVAEKNCRGKGIAKESLLLLMNYAITEIGIRKFVAKVQLNYVYEWFIQFQIGEKNEPSR